MKHLLYLTVLLTLFTLSTPAEEPVLARLSFQIPAHQKATFETAYRTQIEPLLKQHNLVPSSIPQRATPDTIFSKLFKLKTLSDVTPINKTLHNDPKLKRILQNLNIRPVTRNRPHLFFFEAYTSPAEPSQHISAGSGHTRQVQSGTGVWSRYDETDGLAGTSTFATYQDEAGHLWFATLKGVSRYDGLKWQTYTEQDGLSGKYVNQIIKNSSGHLWFATTTGVSTYDGTTWQSYTEQDGLGNDWVRVIHEDTSGNLWFAGLGGVSQWRIKDGPHAWQKWTTQNGLTGNSVYDIFEDTSGHLWFATRGGISRYDGTTWHTIKMRHGLVNNWVRSIFQDKMGNMWFATQNGVSKYNGKTWQTLTTQNGLINNDVWSINQDNTGRLWFSTAQGVCWYDGNHFHTFNNPEAPTNQVRAMFQDREHNIWLNTASGIYRYNDATLQTFTEQDGLTNNHIRTIFQDREGHLWFGTQKGVSRYNGTTSTTFTTQDGLAHNHVHAILQDDTGNMWFATAGGVSQYNGTTFTTFTNQNGLPNNHITNNDVKAMFKDASGHLWFGTSSGVSRYDGTTWQIFTGRDGLIDDIVWSIAQDNTGNMWFGTYQGLSRYDGTSFTTITDPKGLLPNRVHTIFQDTSGNMWFGGLGGVSQYHPQKGEASWQTWTIREGLGGSRVNAIMQDNTGHMWFATSGGVSRYDGQVFQSIIQRDGLANNMVFSTFQDHSGTFWFASKHLTRFRPPPASPPPINIDAVVADQKYVRPHTIRFPNSIPLITFAFHSVSFKTRPEAMVYRYRLRGYQNTWQTTHNRRVEYEALDTGSYTFEIQAIDRDLTYSKLATVTLFVEPPFYLQTRFLLPVVGGSSLLLSIFIFQIFALVKRRRQVRRYQQAAVTELGNAREMQLSLLPKSAPQIEGFDIAGICEPATEVGGDYFTYCHLNGTGHNLGIVLMDVTGHGMRAATTTFLANGMLQSEIRNKRSPKDVLTQMDQSLKDMLPKHAFVATAFAHINIKERLFTHHNAGIPEPILWRNGQSIALNIHNTRPLGSALSPTFKETSIPLQSNDRILFFTDGLTEATNKNGEMYGEKRLLTCLSSLNTQENTYTWITAIQHDVQTFVGNTELEDDLTIVGVHIL